jgi:hypothetical protein
MSVHAILIHQLHIHVSFMSLMRIHQGPPSMSLFMSNSTHYPGDRLRNQLIPWDLHASMVGLLMSDNGFTSLTSDRMIPRIFDLISSIRIRWNVLEYLGNHCHQW